MGFNEKVHAFIAARYYVRLTETYGERGRKAFVHGTQYYAEQRGRRMAQRAIRDGRELNYETYLAYGEWVNTEEVKALGCENRGVVVSYEPDFVKHITQCPWHTQFREMGLTEAGHEYCSHLDNSICRGFNPYLTFDVLQTLHHSDHCIHCIRNAGVSADAVIEKKTEYLKPFSYHCAHSYWAYREVAQTIFGGEGLELAEAVMEDLRQTYGDDMASELLSYHDVNFNCAD